jgi:hypothetical protein
MDFEDDDAPPQLVDAGAEAAAFETDGVDTSHIKVPITIVTGDYGVYDVKTKIF